MNDTDEPYKRQYPLPAITNDHNRIKPRKQSSPAAVTHPTNTNKRPVFSKLFQRGSSKNLPRNNSYVDNTFVYQQKYHLAQEQSFLYRTLGERKYHHIEGSTYLLPCDEEEVDRLHLQHFMVRFAIQGNYLAPVSEVLRKGGRVLDVGCGPGAWSMEIAGEYPKSTVIGIDIAPIYPKDIIPSNCAFYQCNILNKLPFEDNTFDYVFMRFMGQGITADKWASVLSELIRVLKPKGWIEWVETDIEIHRPGPITQDFNQKLMKLMSDHHQDPHIGRTLKERLEQTHALINTTSMYVSCPGGQWAGKLGQLTMQTWKAYYQAFCPLLCQYGDISAEEYSKRLKSCWREADEYKTFENIHFAYAQKKIN
ncbi:S-adenosyl-L-methionine-dependent methyltransferase [Gilbertella persicaria]|uniref:S-adenosyl-L-methionine-dependent methyltransferase n=1 Tax=Gilbertella persicaria TaxID=101096 RepID=UPI002220ABF6|nr:S-adenosyl-L-methionine-dependent methyltransferase [Gilbertella persicaria]KAI8048770.1 S-adenosyl-L-methionine-dependent methyltransferase [Gilbertella persicaria]